jgi:hypothetical protein
MSYFDFIAAAVYPGGLFFERSVVSRGIAFRAINA